MNSSPVTDWASAAAYYSFASDSAMLNLWFWLAVVLCVLPLLAAVRHENEISQRYSSDPGYSGDPAHAGKRHDTDGVSK